MTQIELNELYKKLNEDDEDHYEEWQQILQKLDCSQFVSHHSETASFYETVLESLGYTILTDPVWAGTGESSRIIINPKKVEFTIEEAKALYEIIDQLSGFNASNVFANDGTDDIKRPDISAAVKLFKAAGHSVPENLEE